MKKIININLSGRVIPIEDTAYEKLQAYIESLRRYFAHEEGRDEIINDIESRIAELMNDKIRKGASCINDADIDEIIASMGRPEDFDAVDTEAETTQQSSTGREYSYTRPRGRGRLYRDGSDKFIGGVCSGIANYLNTDPAIVRILFAIITFGGFGLGFLIYILLWIFLPEEKLDDYSGKRLFRNPDDRVIGGVAGGLAAYFNARSSTVRLIFAAPLLLSILLSIIDNFSWRNDFDFFPNIVFGSLSGTFFLAYVVLWIVLPEARTSYDKMEMRGEKVDVNSIRQNVRDGMGNMKDRMKSWSEEVKESAHNFSSRAKEFTSTRGREFADEVKDTARHSGRGIGHAIGVIFKAIFLFIAGTIAFALFVALIALIFGGIAWWPINDFLWTSKWQQLYAWGTIIFFLVVPLVAFIIWVIRRVMGVRRSRYSYMGWTFGFLWTIGWVCGILLAASLAKDFRKYEYAKETVAEKMLPGGRMIVAVSQPELEYRGNFDWINDDGDGWDLSSDTLKLSSVGFVFDKSDDSLYHVFIRKYSGGRSEREATERAERIQYNAVLKDSVLDLASGYAIDRESKFRGQHVEMRIFVPVGKKIRFDRSAVEKLNVHFRFRIWNKEKYSHRYDDVYMNNFRHDVDYIMGDDGNLKDSGGRTIIDRENYRYNDSSKNGSKSAPRSDNAGDEDQKTTRIANTATPGFSIVKSYF